MKILGIESSCDETAAAIVENGTHLICSVVASSKEFHEKTGGIVPEVAARKQVEAIVPVVEACLNQFAEKEGFPTITEAIAHIDSIAITVGPGLVGSLIVGVAAAKALALAWNKPLVPVNHLVGHIYANFVENPVEIQFPAVALLVSGGHTDLVLLRGHGDFEYIGGTLDDAAGESFDKTARLLGLSNYLGGVLLSKKAAECSKNDLAGKLPRPMLAEDNFDFSFSGLKTAVKRLVELQNPPADQVACEFETAVVDVLVGKTIKAAKKYNTKSLLMGGGVAANTQLRTRLAAEAKILGVDFFVPPISLCTDNAVYIAATAYFINKAKDFDEVNADPSLGIMDLA